MRRTAINFLLDRGNEHHFVLAFSTECQHCPFSTVDAEREPPNRSDPGEGYYKCALLDRTIWGENPECSANDWRARMRLELAGEIR